LSAAPGPAELRRAVLARQLLLERSDLPLPRALEAMGGLQAQYAPSMYVGLWSRLRALERGAVTRGLEDRTLVQGTLMRATIHLVSREDYWPLALAVREPRRSWWHRADRAAPAPAAMAQAAGRVRAAMADGPMTRKQVVELIGAEATRGLHIWLDLVRVPPAGTWEKRRADVWLDAERWLGPPPDLDADEARAHLVRRHLGAFGPAAPADVATWAGLAAGDLAGAFERVAPDRIEAADGAELIDLAGAPRPPGDGAVPVRFLPTWDALLLVHVRRTGILPEAHRPAIFSIRNPHSHPVVLVDGVVSGTWRFERGAVQVTPFAALPARVRRAVDAEAARLAAFHA